MLTFVMVNAYGNDFLYVSESLVQSANLPSLARAMCDRHAGAGADGLTVFEPTDDGAAMTLFNASVGLSCPVQLGSEPKAGVGRQGRPQPTVA